ncbi:MAG: DUF4129 domain-containing protein, partial [Lachnospiraceae bacterium]|nr:DUF4129 domain-containing protein [Lachnospiraceae bacterium]
YVEKQMQKDRIERGENPLLSPPTNPPPEIEINYVLVVTVVALLAAVVIFFLFRTNTKKQVRRSAVMVEREKILPTGGVKHRRRRDQRELIRDCYRKFMWMADGAAHRIKPQDTTKEIGERYLKGRKDAEAAVEELTRIYRETRYRGGQCDVKRMKILLDYLKKM